MVRACYNHPGPRSAEVNPTSVSIAVDNRSYGKRDVARSLGRGAPTSNRFPCRSSAIRRPIMRVVFQRAWATKRRCHNDFRVHWRRCLVPRQLRYCGEYAPRSAGAKPTSVCESGFCATWASNESTRDTSLRAWVIRESLPRAPMSNRLLLQLSAVCGPMARKILQSMGRDAQMLTPTSVPFVAGNIARSSRRGAPTSHRLSYVKAAPVLRGLQGKASERYCKEPG